MRLVHISDIHVCAMPGGASAWFDKRVLGVLNHLFFRRKSMHEAYIARAMTLIRSLNPDWVVVTGDLTCTGSPEEFSRGVEALRPLREGLSPLSCIFVPGNHDAYVRAPSCVRALENAFGLLNGGRWELGALPAEVALPGLSMLVLNECRPTVPWLSSGRLSPEARRRFQEWVSRPRKDGEKRVLIGHYPCRRPDGRRFDWRRRLDDDRLVQAALDAGQVDVALCGHRHQPFVREEGSGAVEICAGSLTVHGRINVLDYSPLTGRFTQSWMDVSGDLSDPAMASAAGAV